MTLKLRPTSVNCHEVCVVLRANNGAAASIKLLREDAVLLAALRGIQIRMDQIANLGVGSAAPLVQEAGLEAHLLDLRVANTTC